jgi:dolichyl-phosphate-mannose--protein O-mannosyl transferase
MLKQNKLKRKINKQTQRQRFVMILCQQNLCVCVSFLLLILSAFSHFLHFDKPHVPVWDEFHVGRFVNDYVRHAFFFDLHPPLCKLLYYFVAVIGFGYEGEIECDYHTTPICPTIWKLRIVPVLCGTLLVPLTYLGCLHLGFRQSTSLLCALALLADNFFFSFSRVHLNDIPLTFFIAISLYLSFSTTSRLLPSLNQLPQLILQGLFLGFCLSSKYGMALPIFGWVGLQNIILILRQIPLTYEQKTKQLLSKKSLMMFILFRAFLLLALPITVYLVCMHIHFQIAYKTGGGANYFSPELSATLEDNPNQSKIPFEKRYVFWEKIWEHLIVMINYSKLMAVMFPPGSSINDSLPSEWLYMGKGIVHQAHVTKDVSGFPLVMYQSGNPILWFLVSVSILFSIFFHLFSFFRWVLSKMLSTSTKLHTYEIGFWLSLGWVMYFAPFFLLERQMFVTYYLPAYYFGFLNLFYIIDLMFERVTALTKYAIYSIFLVMVASLHFYLRSLVNLEEVTPEVVFKIQLSNGAELWYLMKSFFG